MGMSMRPDEHFAIVKGSPGEGARLTGLIRYSIPFLVIALIIGYFIGSMLPLPRTDTISLSIAIAILAVAAVFSLKVMGERMDGYLKGAQGEEVAARMLSFFPSQYTVFHSVRLPAEGKNPPMDLDHVLLCSDGIYVIETKNWKGLLTIEGGKVLYNGRVPSRPPIEQTYKEARRLRDCLHDVCGTYYPVVPVLCFVQNRIESTSDVSGVLVCDDGSLMDTILAHSGEAINEDHYKQIHYALDGYLDGLDRRAPNDRIGD